MCKKEKNPVFQGLSLFLWEQKGFPEKITSCSLLTVIPVLDCDLGISFMVFPATSFLETIEDMGSGEIFTSSGMQTQNQI